MPPPPESFQQIEPGDMCIRCMELLGGGIYTQPHNALVLKKLHDEEQHYTCGTCGCYWIHDGGSSGMGWIRPLSL